MADLDIIIASAHLRRVPGNFNLADSLFLGYFTSHLNEGHFNSANGADARTLAEIDYYLGFKGDASIGKSFFSSATDRILDRLEEALKENVQRKRKNSPGLPTVESAIAASVYEDLIKDERVNLLLTKASGINDLKAILLIDRFYDSLYEPLAERVIVSNQSPEQILAELLKQRRFEKGLRELEKDIGSLNEAEAEAKMLAKSSINRKQAQRLLGIQQFSLELASKYDKYRKRDDYTKVVKPLYDKVGLVYGRIEDFIGANTVDLFALLNPDFAPSDEPEKDYCTIERNIGEYERVKNHCSWFERKIPELHAVGKKMKKRHEYLAKVVDAKNKVTTRMNKAAEYLLDVGKAENSLDKNLAHRLLEIEGDIKSNPAEFRQWNEDRYLSSRVAELENMIANCVERIENIRFYAIENANKALDSVEPDYGLSGKLGKDAERLHEEERKLEKGKDLYDWFGLRNGKIGALAKKLDERKNYFCKVKVAFESIEGDRKEILDYLNSIVGICFEKFEKHQLEQLPAMKKKVGNVAVGYLQWKGDLYLKESASEFENLAQEAEKSVDEKINRIISEARNFVVGLNPLESKGLLEEDISLIERQKAGYEKACYVYGVLGHEKAELEAKGDEIGAKEALLKAIKRKWDSVQAEGKLIPRHGERARKLLENATWDNVEKTNPVIAKMADSISAYRQYLNEAPYSYMREFALRALSDMEKEAEKISGYKGKRMIAIAADSGRFLERITDCEKENIWTKVLSIFNVYRQHKLKKCYMQLQAYRQELENLTGMWSFLGTNTYKEEAERGISALDKTLYKYGMHFHEEKMMSQKALRRAGVAFLIGMMASAKF